MPCPECHEQKFLKTTVGERTIRGVLSSETNVVWRHECKKCGTRWEQTPGVDAVPQHVQVPKSANGPRLVNKNAG